jgi:hypothetical protein
VFSGLELPAAHAGTKIGMDRSRARGDMVEQAEKGIRSAVKEKKAHLNFFSKLFFVFFIIIIVFSVLFIDLF